ncbi:MAG: glycoside hydrolase family 16 protein [Sphingobacteriales bacterium]|nr:glycoside hydrolase family 16 protein [Sphingobacteriales bacterium]MBI3717352.1 glycoside hydrolase family 16 protein [Sphingobacteriales bacterium]
MKQLILTIVSVIVLSFISTAQKWKLVWSDEFNYKGLPDSTKWTGEVGGHGWGNNEAQFYTGLRKENARVENGKLIIEARKENWEDKNYTSARLITKDKGDWQYGKIEVKAKIPKGRGTWPAIWMLGSKTPLEWPDDGEIDIMEHVGFHQGFIHASIHCKKYNHIIGTQKTDTTFLNDCSDKFHIYGVEWSKDSLKISVDRKVYFSFANEHKGYDGWPFDNKVFLILNVAVGGNWGGQKGIDEKVFPAKMEIDYVRVWQKK